MTDPKPKEDKDRSHRAGTDEDIEWTYVPDKEKKDDSKQTDKGKEHGDK